MRLPFFLWRVSVITLLSLSSLSCRQRENRIVFYEDEKTVKIEVEYLNGEKDGVEKTYYSNGQLRSETSWRAGKKDGVAKEFYSNGRIGAFRNFHNGLRVNETQLFDADGNRIETQFFDSIGRLVDFRRYLKDGSIAENLEQPIGLLMEDSVSLTDTVEFSVRLGNISDFRLNKGIFIVGSEFILDNFGHPTKLRDTLVAVSSNENNYTVKTIAKKRGLNFIRGQLIYLIEGSGQDSLQSFFVEQTFFVK